MVYYLFPCLLTFCALQRLVELAYSRRNREGLLASGFERCETTLEFLPMLLVHTAWFVGMLVERRSPVVLLPLFVSYSAALIFVMAQFGRIWVLASLGKHWNVSVLGAGTAIEFVVKGPYRFLRHPNYLIVIIELTVLPLVGGALVTAILASLINGFVLHRRIAVEEKQLKLRPGYWNTMGAKGCLLPRLVRAGRLEP